MKLISVEVPPKRPGHDTTLPSHSNPQVKLGYLLEFPRKGWQYKCSRASSKSNKPQVCLRVTSKLKATRRKVCLSMILTNFTQILMKSTSRVKWRWNKCKRASLSQSRCGNSKSVMREGVKGYIYPTQKTSRCSTNMAKLAQPDWAGLVLSSLCARTRCSGSCIELCPKPAEPAWDRTKPRFNAAEPAWSRWAAFVQKRLFQQVLMCTICVLDLWVNFELWPTFKYTFKILLDGTTS